MITATRPSESESESETFPLLDEEEQIQGRLSHEEPAPTRPSASLPPPQQRRIVTLLSLGILVFATSGGLVAAPLTRLLEDNLCRTVQDNAGSPDEPLDEDLCKGDEIQSQMAYILGLLTTLDAVVGLVFAFPFGVAADKIGRKPVIFIGATGTILSSMWMCFILWFPSVFPVRLMLLEAAFQIIGGGNTALISVLYSIVADVASEADRATYFFVMAFSALTGAFLGPLLSSVLMGFASPWVPMLISIACSPLALIFIAMLPETLPFAQKQSSLKLVDVEEVEDSSLRSHLLSGVVHLKRSFSILTNFSLILLLTTSLTRMPEILATTQFFLQYISKRFSWTLAEAGYLLGVRAIITIAVLLGLLPALGKLLQSKNFPFRLTPPARDLFLARCSALCAAVGALLMAGPSLSFVVVGLAINTLAAGMGPLLRSLTASFVDPADTSKLYTVISIVETIGSLYAGPVIAWCFSTGMRLKGLWLGLPYMWIAAIFGMVFVVMLFVRAPEHVSTEQDEDGGADGALPAEARAGVLQP